jgi:hypothetical protein
MAVTPLLERESVVREGTYEITGTIYSVSWRSRSNDRAWGTWSRRPHVGMMVILDSGPWVWGTMPRSIERALIPVLHEHRDSCVNYAELVEHVTVRVGFTATVKRSLEPGHADGFFSHPRDAVLLDTITPGPEE